MQYLSESGFSEFTNFQIKTGQFYHFYCLNPDFHNLRIFRINKNWHLSLRINFKAKNLSDEFLKPFDAIVSQYNIRMIFNDVCRFRPIVLQIVETWTGMFVLTGRHAVEVMPLQGPHHGVVIPS